MTEAKVIRLRTDTVSLIRRSAINPRDPVDLSLRKLMELALGDFNGRVFTKKAEWTTPTDRYKDKLPLASLEDTGHTTPVRIRPDTLAALDQLKDLFDETGYDPVINKLVNYMVM